MSDENIKLQLEEKVAKRSSEEPISLGPFTFST